MKFNSPFIQKVYEECFENDQFKLDEAIIDEDIRLCEKFLLNFSDEDIRKCEKLLLNFGEDVTYNHNIKKDERPILNIRWNPNDKRLKIFNWNDSKTLDNNFIDAPLEIKREGWIILGEYISCLLRGYPSSWNWRRVNEP